MRLNKILLPSDIREVAGTNIFFKRGEAYYKQNKVLKAELTFFPGEEHLSAVVKGSSRNIYKTHAIIEDDGYISEYECTCPAYSSYGTCKHIVAILIYRYHHLDSSDYIITDNIEQNYIMGTDSIKTHPNISHIIHNFILNDIASVKAESDVKLLPTLDIYNGAAYLSLTVGRTRQYIIKNIESFCNNVKIRATINYGKELELFHHPNYFDDTSRPLLNFILHKQEEKYQFAGSYINSNTDKRKLKLLQADMDELFNILKGCHINISIDGRNKNTALLTDKSPQFYLQLKSIERQDGFVLSLPDCQYIIGDKHIYIYCDGNSEFGKEYDLNGILCRCPEEFSLRIKDLLQMLIGPPDYFNISSKDMPSFYSNVLAELKDIVDIRGDMDQVQSYIPMELDAKFYFDSPEKDLITVSVEYMYGDVSIDPMEDNNKLPASVARNEKSERKITLLLNQYFKYYDPAQKLMFFRGNDDSIYEFATKGLDAFFKLGEVLVTDRFRSLCIQRVPKISVGVKLESDLLQIDVDTNDLSVEEAMEALKQYRLKKRYYRMKNGSFMKLDDTGFTEFADMIETLGLSQKDLTNNTKGSQTTIQVPKYRALYLDHLLKRSNTNINYERDSNFKNLVRNMKSIEDSDFTIHHDLDQIMRSYQKDGFRWLATMDKYGFSGILADDMGLGKTLQVISLILTKKEEGENIKTLVVCPASLILNWQNEIQKFAPKLSTVTIMGTLKERKALLKNTDEYDILITSYDLLKRDIEYYQDICFRYHIIDEAQYIKNQGTQNAKAVRLINSTQRFALTGTPIENRLSELWSIFHFLMPGYLYSYKRFKETYETPIAKDGNVEKATMLSNQVAPFILRRLKGNVLKDLPEKVESVMFSRMHDEQQKLYLANLARANKEINRTINENGFENSRIVILSILTRLRQLCCHPALCYENYKDGSAKLEVCIELLKEATQSRHKVLLFSQFTSMLEIIEKRLNEENLKYYKLTGSTPKEKRVKLVDNFNENDTQVFLISLKAGGTGLNLTGADVVIHYDPWWNIAAQNQATDRTHRIGQKNSVHVYKLIEKGSIEEKILKMQESKKDLADAVVKDEMAGLATLTQEALLELLKT